MKIAVHTNNTLKDKRNRKLGNETLLCECEYEVMVAASKYSHLLIGIEPMCAHRNRVRNDWFTYSKVKANINNYCYDFHIVCLTTKLRPWYTICAATHTHTSYVYQFSGSLLIAMSLRIGILSMAVLLSLFALPSSTLLKHLFLFTRLSDQCNEFYLFLFWYSWFYFDWNELIWVSVKNSERGEEQKSKMIKDIIVWCSFVIICVRRGASVLYGSIVSVLIVFNDLSLACTKRKRSRA